MKVWGTLACLAFVVVCHLIIRHVQAKKAARGEDVISPFARHFDNGAGAPGTPAAPAAESNTPSTDAASIDIDSTEASADIDED